MSTKFFSYSVAFGAGSLAAYLLWKILTTRSDDPHSGLKQFIVSDFDSAVEIIQNKQVKDISRNDQLELYALYKQATLG